jgi:hypothetical protein
MGKLNVVCISQRSFSGRVGNGTHIIHLLNSSSPQTSDIPVALLHSATPFLEILEPNFVHMEAHTQTSSYTDF